MSKCVTSKVNGSVELAIALHALSLYFNTICKKPQKSSLGQRPCKACVKLVGGILDRMVARKG